MLVSYHLLLPIALSSALLVARKAVSLRMYVGICLVPTLISVAIWLTQDRIYYYWRGPKMAAGFYSWAFLATSLSIAGICAVRVNSIAGRVLQVFFRSWRQIFGSWPLGGLLS